MPWLELIGEPELDAPWVPEVGVVQIADMAGIALHQHLALEVEQLGLWAAFAPPSTTCQNDGRKSPSSANGHRRSGTRVLVIHQNIAATGLVLQRLHLGQQGAVLLEETVAGLEIPSTRARRIKSSRHSAGSMRLKLHLRSAPWSGHRGSPSRWPSRRRFLRPVSGSAVVHV